MRFRNGYNKAADLTEDEYWAQQDYDFAADGWVPDEYVEAVFESCPGHESTSGPLGNTVFCDGSCLVIEGEPYEDTYLPGIPDYDRFNRPSWGGR